MAYPSPCFIDYSPRLSAFRNHLLQVLNDLGFHPSTDPDGIISSAIKLNEGSLFIRVDYVFKKVTVELYEKCKCVAIIDGQYFEDGLALRDMIVSIRQYREYAREMRLPIFTDLPKVDKPISKTDPDFFVRAKFYVLGVIVGAVFATLICVFLHGV